MAITTYGSILQYADIASPQTWTGAKTINIKTKPSMLGKRSSHETTTMMDDAQTFIAGIRQQSESFDFLANWDKTLFGELNSIDEAKAWKLTFGDGSSFTWQGRVYVSNNEGEVDALEEMTISVAPETVPVFSAA